MAIMMNFLIPPIFDDEDKTLTAHHLFIIIWTFMAVGWLAILIAIIIPETVYRWLLIIGVIESAGLILLALNKLGHTRLVSHLLIFAIWAAATGMALTGGGTSSNAMAIYFIIVLIAGLLQSGKAGIITALLCSFTGLFLVYLEYGGALPASQVPHTPLTQWIANTIYMAIIISLQYLVSRTIRNALKQSRQEMKERQRADAALRESEEKYRNMVENVSDVIYEIDSQGMVIYISPVVKDIMGYEQADIVGKNFIEFVSEDDRSLLIGRFFELSEGIEYPFEYRLISKSGDIRWVRTKTSPITEGGSFKGARGTLIDITDRKQAEEALQKSEAEQRWLLDSISNAFVLFESVFDEKGKFVSYRFQYINKAYERITGVRNEEVKGKTVHEVWPETEHSWIENYGEVAVTGITKEFNMYHNPTKKHYSCCVYRPWDTKERFCVVFEDITARKQAQEALQESQAELQAIFETVGTGILIIDKDTQIIIEANKAAIEMTGLPKERIMGQICHSLVCPAQAGKCPVKDLGQSVDHSERKLIHADGHLKDILKTVYPITIKGRDYYLESFVDITDRKQAEKALRESEELFRSYLEHAPDGIYMSDLEGNFLYGNSKCEEMIGYRREELIGKNLLELNILPGKYLDKAAQLLQANIEGKSTGPDEFDLITKEGRLIPVEINTGVVQRMGQVIVLASVRDITERKQTDEKIQQMAYHDSLTGLPNRKLFSDRLAIALAHAQRNQKGVAVTMLDLDNFKNVNDNLGHDVGDLLLKAAAERLSAALRKGDTVARFGGDEFVLILPDLKGIEDAIQVAQKIVDSFRQPFLIDTHQLIVTTSIGIAVYPHDGTDEGILLKNADIAMYQVKQTGRNRYQLYKKA
jgi:diguanylate cyclase (GGDEF)-like protein/PAS domain S-box-containing protein